MPKTLLALFLFVTSLAFTQTNDSPSTTVNGRWLVSADFYGTPIYFQMKLGQQGEKLTGDFGGDKLEGALRGSDLRFLAKDEQGGTEEGTAKITNGTISGQITFKDSPEDENPRTRPFTATLVPPRGSAPPKRHEFVPQAFYRQFAPNMKPVLTIAPGDTIHTTTVDAGGADEKGVTRVLGGNPQTGPFFVETALPGYTLVVHINKLRLNRDYAISDDGIVDRGLTSDLAVQMKDGFKDVRWHLDLQRSLASPEKPGEHMKNYSVPVRPMLGCVAAGPGSAQAPPGTGDSGRFGGNMDYNEIVEGATVYLPVSVPGALLYFGDGHAVQGGGELNGNALETSMDVEVTVDVIPGKRPPSPRVENASHFIAMGLGGSIDGAFKNATANMAAWLKETYSLTPSEIAQVLGTASEFHVSEVADRNAGVVLKINKAILQGLSK